MEGLKYTSYQSICSKQTQFLLTFSFNFLIISLRNHNQFMNVYYFNYYPKKIGLYTVKISLDAKMYIMQIITYF